jgi:dynein regulatory complex protein 1
MEGQYKTFQRTLNEELDQIERAFVEERTDLLGKHNSEIENLLVNRRENER